MKLHETVIYVFVFIYIYCYSILLLYTQKCGHIEVSSDSIGSSRGWKGSDHVQMLKVLQVTFSLKGCVVLCHPSGVFIYACPKRHHSVAFRKQINFTPLWNSQARSKFRTRHD